MSSDDYNRLRTIFSDARISVMTDEEIEKYLSADLENAVTSSIYYKGVSRNNDSYTWTEVNEDEFNDGNEISPFSAIYQTNYKKVSLSAIPLSTGQYYFSLTASWKVVPVVRSFDVIAMRFRNVALLSDSTSGMQVYKKTGNTNYSYVNYSPNGTNTLHQNNGFGTSMNIVDDNISYLECNINATGQISGSDPRVFGSYQHAVNNVTLAQSQQYTISSAGYGNVINFTEAVQNKYDAMNGVDIDI